MFSYQLQMRAKKRCSRCGVEKPVGDFYRRWDSGLPRSECKVCQAAGAGVRWVAYAVANPKRVMLSLARQRARGANVPFDLHEDDFEIPTHCPVLGVELRSGRGRRGPTDASPTLDRIVPSLGYVPGNVIVVSWRANRLKSDGTMDELVKVVAFYCTMG